MKKKLLLFTIIALSTFFFVDCKKCKSKQYDEKILVDDDLLVLTYTGNEKLVFKNAIGDSMCFTGQGRSSEMEERSSNPDYDGSGCMPDKRMVEKNSVRFKYDNADTTLSIDLMYYSPFGSYENDKVIVFRYYHEMSSRIFDGIFSYSLAEIENPKISSLTDFYFISAYYHVVTLGNKTFNDVYELICFGYPGVALYYSVVNGIVGIKRPSGVLWYLDRKY